MTILWVKNSFAKERTEWKDQMKGREVEGVWWGRVKGMHRLHLHSPFLLLMMTQKSLSGPGIHFVCFDDCAFLPSLFTWVEWEDPLFSLFHPILLWWSHIFPSFRASFLILSHSLHDHTLVWRVWSLEDWDDVMRKRLHSVKGWRSTRERRETMSEREEADWPNDLTSISPDFICLHHPSSLLLTIPQHSSAFLYLPRLPFSVIYILRGRRNQFVHFTLPIRKDSHEMILIASRASSFDAGKHDYIS